MARKYELKRRAEHQEETRRRIVEATVELHESVGLAYTTISAIAERAGVERATVYRHFPDERSLFTACTSHYLAANPPPDPASLRRIADPLERLEVGLSEIYAYHRRTEEMNYKAQRDLPQFPALAEVLAPYLEHWGRSGDVLATGWQTQHGDTKLLRAAIGHAINFQTWRSLARGEGLDDSEAVELMAAMIRCVAQGSEDDNASRSGA